MSTALRCIRDVVQWSTADANSWALKYRQAKLPHFEYNLETIMYNLQSPVYAHIDKVDRNDYIVAFVDKLSLHVQ